MKTSAVVLRLVGCALLAALSDAVTLASTKYLTSSVLSSQYVSASIVDTSTLTTTGGLFAQPVSLGVNTKPATFDCNRDLFKPDLAAVPAILPGFNAGSSQSCNSASFGAGLQSSSCKWNPQTFLGMMYDRGIELMRHGIPQADAFQA
jgi:hypothetical protein